MPQTDFHAGTGASSPSSHAPLAFGLRKPILELLSPSFWAMYGGGSVLLGSLLSWTIWDHCMEELNTHSDGTQPPTSVEDLLSSFRPILSDIVISQIQLTLEALEESTLGVETTFVPSKENILGNVLITLQESAYGSDEGGRAHEQGERRRSAHNAAQSVRGRGAGGRSGGRGKGGRSGGGGRHGGQGGDDGQEREFLEALDGQVFQDVEQIIVSLGDYVTPPKVEKNVVLCRARALSIAERARLFSQHFVARADIVLYNPYLTRGFACFYHGTRLSSSHKFSRCGIKPFKSGTEFSPDNAFYVINQVQAAFEFPLFNHLGKDPRDTVVVFQFDLSLEILHGEIPPPNRERTFKVRWFESGVDGEAWDTFCNHNMYSEHPRRGHDFDIVIGAMCLPNPATRRVAPRSQRDLLQVGFCTEAAWKWVGSCLKRKYIESRMGV